MRVEQHLDRRDPLDLALLILCAHVKRYLNRVVRQTHGRTDGECPLGGNDAETVLVALVVRVGRSDVNGAMRALIAGWRRRSRIDVDDVQDACERYLSVNLLVLSGLSDGSL